MYIEYIENRTYYNAIDAFMPATKPVYKITHKCTPPYWNGPRINTKTFPGISFSSSSLFRLFSLPNEGVIILKFKIMTTFYQNFSIVNNEPNLWEAFLNYLYTEDLPNAEDLLDTELMVHEYQAFISTHISQFWLC